MDVQDYFSKVEDPRVVGRCKHKLSDILVIALASYLCGGEDYELMHELCLERGNSLRPLVELPNGCPSVDTFERVLQRIEPQSLYACLQIYGKELISDLGGKHIAIDGKRLKGSKKKTGSTHILSAWVDEVGLSLAQETVAEKRNELQAIPEVLDSLDLSGSVISIDAMGTQTNIAEQIIQHMETHILPRLIPDQRAFEKVPDYMVADEELNKEIEYGKNMTVEALKDSMEVSLARTEKEAKAYWNTLSAYEQELLETSDEELNNEGKFFGRLFRRIFSRTDKSLKWIDKYDDRKHFYRRGGACGPWVCGYPLCESRQR